MIWARDAPSPSHVANSALVANALSSPESILPGRSKDRGVFPFVAFLEANPDLKTLILSVVVRPMDFGPSLLYLLPNLSAIECESSEPSEASVLPLHRTSLACLRRLGARVQTLCLVNVSFPTSLALAQLLLALEGIAHLVCTDVVIKTEGKKGPLDAAKRRLSERLRLRSLAIDSQSLAGGDRDASVGALLFDSDLAPSMLESFRLIRIPGSDTFLHRSTWSRLSSLVLQLPYDYEVVANAAEFLENFKGPNLKEVALELGPVRSIVEITRDDLSTYSGEAEPQSSVHSRLERTLLRFSLPRITWIVDTPLHAGRNAFWIRELGKHFPVLFRQGALELKAPRITPAGHDDRVKSLVVSPDGKWVASASDDSTITLWDINSKTAVQQWVARGYMEVLTLAFSPDSRYLLSNGEDGKAAIWDLSDGVRSVTTHHARRTRLARVELRVVPRGQHGRGRVLGRDGAALGHPHIPAPPHRDLPGSAVVRLVAFSPDGRWLLSASPPSNYCLWEAASGRLHRVLQSQLRADGPARPRAQPVAAAFHPGSMCLAAASGVGVPEVWDVATGDSRLALGRLGRVDDVSFSSDGKLLLAASDRRVLLRDLDAGRTRFSLASASGGGTTVRKACFSPCGKYVAAASGHTRVWVWRSSDGLGGEMLEHEHRAEHVAFSPDGETSLLSGTVDGTVFFNSVREIPMPSPRSKAQKPRRSRPILSRIIRPSVRVLVFVLHRLHRLRIDCWFDHAAQSPYDSDEVSLETIIFHQGRRRRINIQHVSTTKM